MRADSSGDSNSVQMGSIVTECSAVTKQVVAKNGPGTEIVSSSERYKGESDEGGSFIISNVVDVDDEYVNMHLRKRACASGSTGDEEVINLKGCKNLTDRTGHV